jgi:site-specific DNA-methyltransferase (adenine-specific)
MNIELYNTDCTEFLTGMSKTGRTVDCIITDLPYFRVVKDGFDNQWKDDVEYLNRIEKLVGLSRNVLKPGGNIILFCSRQNTWKISEILDRNGFSENRTIIWARKRGFNTTRGKALASGYEPILFWSNGASCTFNNIKIHPVTDRSEYTTGTLKDGITMSDVWTDIPALPHNSKEKVGHPTQKPVRLMERIVQLFTNQGDTVLDFCMGSGSTGAACKNLDRNFIGVEIDRNYFHIADERLNNK